MLSSITYNAGSWNDHLYTQSILKDEQIYNRYTGNIIMRDVYSPFIAQV